ncbi:LysR family transcriptional regulator [uncultured Ruthenibacterium sp.]|uniref:LysR family transcriptional regulator n=1 Tax=uncultured Ruthenibacterium sp. TaxID=1905347 RepID=UPI00349EFF01
MDLTQMRYAVEIAQCGSISKAAKKLYMGQPNLSKALRELEEELGCSLFRRTSQGIEPTRAGEEFLVYARKILGQVESLKALYQHKGQTEIQLSLCVPRASYVASAFCQWAQGHANGQFRLQYREANASDTIQNVFTGDAHLGIVRYHTERADYFEGLAAAKGLHLAPLWDFHMVALMHKSHPLAPIADISPSRLAEYPEVLHGDITATSPEDISPTAQDSQSGSHILVYDRAAQFDVLRSVRGSFMWVSPMPAEVLEREQLVQRPCSSGWVYRDAAIWRGHLPDAASGFLDTVHEEINALMQV